MFTTMTARANWRRGASPVHNAVQHADPIRRPDCAPAVRALQDMVHTGEKTSPSVTATSACRRWRRRAS